MEAAWPPKRWFPTTKLQGATTKKITNTLVVVFWVLTPCRQEDHAASIFTLKMETARSSKMLVSYHSLRGVTTQKTLTLIFIAVKTSNPARHFLFNTYTFLVV